MKRLARLLPIALALSGGLLEIRCSRSGYQPDADALARQLVVAWMRVRDRTLIGGEHRTFDAANVRFQSQPSSVVPGLAYWWGYYAPPGTADAYVEIAAARGTGDAVLLETPSDWLKAIKRVGWTPRDETAALEACSEAVQLAGARASHLSAPFLYKGPSSLANERLLPVIARDLANMHRLTSPTIRQSPGGGWEAGFWMIEGRQTTRYSCHLDKAVLVLAPKDSIPDVGLLTPGP